MDIVLKGGDSNVGVVIEEAEGTLDDVDGFGDNVGDCAGEVEIDWMANSRGEVEGKEDDALGMADGWKEDGLASSRSVVPEVLWGVSDSHGAVEVSAAGLDKIDGASVGENVGEEDGEDKVAGEEEDESLDLSDGEEEDGLATSGLS